MKFDIQAIMGLDIAEVILEKEAILDVQDVVDLLGNLYYQGFDKVILYQQYLTPDFFDLKTGVAGDLLQKFSNYRIRLAIVGDFSAHQSQSLQAFITESNKRKHILFVPSKSEAIAQFTN